ADSYEPIADPQAWFDQIRTAAAANGFAATPKEHKAAPGVYHGSIREAAQVIRVALTGSTRSRDLFAVATTLGPAEVTRRVRALAARYGGAVEIRPSEVYW